MTGDQVRVLVFDEGPLSHFAEAGWLGLLKMYVGPRQAWLPDTVHRELGQGVDAYPHLRGVLDAPWLMYKSVASPTEKDALEHFMFQLLGPLNENLGECGVLALAQTHDATAVVDDGTARNIAADNGVQVITTVAILCDLINQKALSLDAAATVADHLLATEYRLPFEEGGFIAFVRENDLIVDLYG